MLHQITDQGTIEYCMHNKVIKAVSTVADGNMSWAWGEKDVVRKNREGFFAKHDLNYTNSVFAYLTHGTDIQVVGKKDCGQEFKCDSLVTTEKGVVLALCVADCLPVVMVDEVTGVLALMHLGWRGVDGKLVQKTIEKMLDLGCETDQITVWIGPGVRKDSYIKYGLKLAEFWGQVKEDDKKEEWKLFMVKQPGEIEKYSIDLPGYVVFQLQAAGVEMEKIEISEIDTILDRNYFSHYRAGEIKEPEGRFVTIATLK